MIREIYDKGKVLLLGEDGPEHYTELPQGVVDSGERWYPRWGGNPGVTSAGGTLPPNTMICATSMEPGGFLPTPIHRPVPAVTEWRCKSCESVMLAEHRKCEDCGAPRHFLYKTGADDRTPIYEAGSKHPVGYIDETGAIRRTDDDR